jgi:hypothetical protein
LSLPASEGKGMSPRSFEAMQRALVSERSRRSALAGAIIAVLGALFPAVSEARRTAGSKRIARPKKTRGTKSGKSKSNKNKKKNKDKNQKKGKTRKNCKIRHSEQQIIGFIEQAAKQYGQSKDVMIRVARCESTLNPCAVNPEGPWYGLFQYLKSTWKSTPYGNEDIFDPKAQALATGWMWKQGRKNEWVCQ